MKHMLMLAAALLITGCATTGNEEKSQAQKDEQRALERHHAIYVDQHGNLRKREQEAVAVDATITQQQLPAESKKDDDYVAAIIANFLKLRTSKPDMKMVVFVHGGLNTFDNAWGRATLFSEAMLREGSYPVFIGWNSGPFTNYWDHLTKIRRGERRPVHGALSAPFILIEDVLRSVARVPEAWYMTFDDPRTVMKSQNTTRERYVEERQKILKDLQPAFNIRSCGPFTGVGSSYYTIINPVKLVTAPFVDGLGSGSWDSMLRRTDLVLSKSLAFEGSIDPKAGADSDTAVTKLFERLEELTKPTATGGGEKIRIDLIGHSMGAIVVNNILARHPKLKVDNVVFMGAAAPVKDIENGVVPWMRRADNEARFFNLSLDPYREISESTAYDFLPRGSLLHWIDSIFGEVNSFKDRSAGGWWNIIRTAEDVFPADIRHRVFLTRFPIGGESAGPQVHTDFDEYYFWRQSFWLGATGLKKFDPAQVAPRQVEDELQLKQAVAALAPHCPER